MSHIATDGALAADPHDHGNDVLAMRLMEWRRREDRLPPPARVLKDIRDNTRRYGADALLRPEAVY